MDRWADLRACRAGHMLRAKGRHHPQQRRIFLASLLLLLLSLLLFRGNSPNVCTGKMPPQSELNGACCAIMLF